MANPPKALARLRSLPERWPWLRFVIGIQKRFAEVRGRQLASSLTLASFMSLFPLLLVGIAVLGFLSVGSSDLPGTVIDKLGLTGAASDTVRTAIQKAQESRRAASVVGLVGLLWSGLNMVVVMQAVYNSVWQVKGRGIKDKLFGLGWLGGAALIFVASFALTAVLQVLPGWLAPVGILIGLAVDTALFLWTASVLPNRDVPWRALLPGAIVGGIGLEALKALGSLYLPRAVSSSSALYGSIGIVFAVITWLFLFARLVVYSAVVNVVLWERHEGTVTVEVETPRMPGQAPVEATRGGQVTAER